MANKKEQGFNDAELQDIMSEIENLEREYDEEKPSAEVEASPVEEHIEEVVEAFSEKEEHEEKVIDIKSKSTPAGEHPVEFQASGQMNFSMNFEVGGQTAHLEITEQGLVVSLDGMNLSIDETDGCTVDMDGGVKFSVPMGGQVKGSKAA